MDERMRNLIRCKVGFGLPKDQRQTDPKDRRREDADELKWRILCSRPSGAFSS